MISILAQYSEKIGIAGVCLVLVSYYLLNINKLSSTDIKYLLMNCIGSSLILFSLLFDWNLSAALIEGAWALISLFGIYRVTRARRQTKPDNVYIMPKKRA